MTNFLKRLFGGGSDESSTSEAGAPVAEPAAPEPSVAPAEPAAPSEQPAVPATSDEAASDAGDEPA